MLKIAHQNDGTTRPIHLAGWKKQIVDPRDAGYSLKLHGALTGRPSALDLRSVCSPIEDQGALGSCTAQMCAALIEANENQRVQALRTAKVAAAPQVSVTGVQITKGVTTFVTTVTPAVEPVAPTPKFVNVSRLFQYYATRVIQGTVNEDSGASIRDTIKSSYKYGVADELLWPYAINKFTTNPPKNVWDTAATHKVTSYHAIQDGDLESMKTVIASGFLVGFGFEVFDYFLTADMSRKGLLTRPQPTESLQGGHAVCLVGYDDNKAMPDGTKGAFLVRNSWGSGWGLAGYYWQAYNYVGDRNLCSDFWVVKSSPI